MAMLETHELYSLVKHMIYKIHTPKKGPSIWHPEMVKPQYKCAQLRKSLPFSDFYDSIYDIIYLN